ncbi:MAG: hypothetical protein AABY07_10295 [Nanoarchaeota archaeon]
MPLKDYLFQDFKLKAESIFDLGELYKSLFRWFELHNYSFFEREYKDIDEPAGKHIEIFWQAEKEIDAYVKFVIELNYFVLGMQKVEIEKGGVKIKTNKATMEFRITAYLLKDYGDKFSKAPLGKEIRFIYDKIIAKSRLDKYEGLLTNEVNQMMDEIKAFIDIHKY